MPRNIASAVVTMAITIALITIFLDVVFRNGTSGISSSGVTGVYNGAMFASSAFVAREESDMATIGG